MPDYFCASCGNIFSVPEKTGEESAPLCSCGKAARKLLSPGEDLGGCRIGKHLSGKGAISFYLAEQTAIRRPVLLKVLDTSIPGGAARLNQFQEEARNSAKFLHPNVISVINAGRRGPLRYCVFPDVPGKKLSLIPEEGNLCSPGEALTLLRPIAEALQSLWQKQQTAHGCLCPDDLLLSPDGDVFLRNFWDRPVETSRILAGDTSCERVAYLAPERLKNVSADPLCDLYSLGAILYFMTTGKRPFQGMSREEIQQALSAKKTFLAPSEEFHQPWGNAPSPAFQAFLVQLCAPDREHRISGWEAFFEEENLLKGALLREGVPPAERHPGPTAHIPPPAVPAPGAQAVPPATEGKKQIPPAELAEPRTEPSPAPRRKTFGIVLRLLLLLFAIGALTALGIYFPRREEIRRSNALLAEAEKAWNEDLPKFPDKYHAARNHAGEKKVRFFNALKFRELDKKFDSLRPSLVRAAELREKYRVSNRDFQKKLYWSGVDVRWEGGSYVLHPLGTFRISRFLREREKQAKELEEMGTIFRSAEKGSLLRRLLSPEENRVKMLTDAFRKFDETYCSDELDRSQEEYRARYNAAFQKFIMHLNICGLVPSVQNKTITATHRFSEGAFLFFEEKLEKDFKELKEILDEAKKKDPRLKELFSDPREKSLSQLKNSFDAFRKTVSEKTAGKGDDQERLFRKWTAASGYLLMLLHRNGIKIHYPRHVMTANDSFRKEEFAKNRGEMEECLREMEKILPQFGTGNGLLRNKQMSARYRTKMLRMEFGKFCSSVDEGVIPRIVPEEAGKVPPGSTPENIPPARRTAAASPNSPERRFPGRTTPASPGQESALKLFGERQARRWKLCCSVFLNLSLPGRTSGHAAVLLRKFFPPVYLPGVLKDNEEALRLYRREQEKIDLLQQLFRKADSFYSRLSSSGTLCRNCTVYVDGFADRVESIQDQYVTTHRKKTLRLAALGRRNLVHLSHCGAERSDALKKERFAFLLKLCAFEEAGKAAENMEEKELADDLAKLYPGEIRNSSQLLLLGADLRHLPREQRTSALREEYRLLQEAVKKRDFPGRQGNNPPGRDENRKRRMSGD
ncbi:MAG: protein kinase [Lentisphaeria bacterium]|nr:protein kinase [Lentisphaeria bacterium]